VIFKDLSTLVYEQGSILDRIDYNIEETHKNVGSTKKELLKTQVRENSWRARGCITCEVATILVCLGILYAKTLV